MVSVVEREGCVPTSESGRKPPTGRVSTVAGLPEPASRAELLGLIRGALKILGPMRYPVVGAAYRSDLCYRMAAALAREPKAIDAREVDA
jgi:hypothetical protein